MDVGGSPRVNMDIKGVTRMNMDIEGREVISAFNILIWEIIKIKESKAFPE